MLRELVENYSELSAYQVAAAYAFRGEADRAFELLERARNQKDMGLIFLTCDPMLGKIRGDPRYTSFLKKLHLTR